MFTLKKCLFIPCVLVLLMSNEMVASTNKRSPISAYVSTKSNYLWRGITRNNAHISLEGGFEYSHDLGLYVGNRMAAVEFADSDSSVASPRAFEQTEFYAGYVRTVGSMRYDIGFIQYDYPGANASLNYDFMEGYISVGYSRGDVGMKLSVNRSNSFWADSGEATFVDGSVNYKVDKSWLIQGSLGHQSVENNTAYGQEDYTVGAVGLSYALDDRLATSASLSKTNLSKGGLNRPGDVKLVVGLTASF